MRVAVDWRSCDRNNYKDFCKKNKDVEISYELWKKIIYSLNEAIRDKILETGDKFKFPLGFGEISINKRKRKKMVFVNGEHHINLPVDWQKTKQKGKVIYNFNYHTEGYYFGWMWFKNSTSFKQSKYWYFKPYRVSSRKIAEYLKKDEKYQHIYKEWSLK